MIKLSKDKKMIIFSFSVKDSLWLLERFGQVTFLFFPQLDGELLSKSIPHLPPKHTFSPKLFLFFLTSLWRIKRIRHNYINSRESSFIHKPIHIPIILKKKKKFSSSPRGPCDTVCISHSHTYFASALWPNQGARNF